MGEGRRNAAGRLNFFVEKDCFREKWRDYASYRRRTRDEIARRSGTIVPNCTKRERDVDYAIISFGT